MPISEFLLAFLKIPANFVSELGRHFYNNACHFFFGVFFQEKKQKTKLAPCNIFFRSATEP